MHPRLNARSSNATLQSITSPAAQGGPALTLLCTLLPPALSQVPSPAECNRPCDRHGCMCRQAPAAAAAAAAGAPRGALTAAAAALGLCAVPVVAWSLYTLGATGAPPTRPDPAKVAHAAHVIVWRLVETVCPLRGRTLESAGGQQQCWLYSKIASACSADRYRLSRTVL